MSEPWLLAADVGGTKTRLGLFADDPTRPLREAETPTASHSSAAALFDAFLGPDRATVRAAVVGVAGPVLGGAAQAVNLPWPVEESSLAASLGLSSVRLLNDLAATAWGLDLLPETSLHTLQEGCPDPEGPRALLAPGTGLGEAILLPGEMLPVVLPTEGGHADYAPSTEEEEALRRFLAARFGHVSWERVASGLGFGNLLAFLAEARGLRPLGEPARALSGGEEPGAVVAAHAHAGGDPACRRAMELFLRSLGAEAGNLALKTLPLRGLVLCGGIPGRILPHLGGEIFLDAFRAKGRMEPLMRRIPVKVAPEPRAALWGAARYGLCFPPS